jgi:hypothetical protein
VESGFERDIDTEDEAASGTNLIPSLDREWFSDEELPPTATRHNQNNDHPTLPIPPINIPVHPSPPPIDPPVPSISTPRSQSSEGDVSLIAFGDQEPPPTNISEGATSSSEEDVEQKSLSEIRRESISRSKCWDEKLPDKRRRKPNPKYTQLSSAKIKLGDLNQAVLMGLDWSRNQLHSVPSHYSKIMALFQLGTDPFTNEIDGDLHPCLLASKASQADNPTFEEAMNSPHREGFHEAMAKEIKTLEDMNCWEVNDRVPGSNVLPSTWAFKLKFYLSTKLDFVRAVTDKSKV